MAHVQNKSMNISVAGPDGERKEDEQLEVHPALVPATGDDQRASLMSSFSDYAPSEVTTARGSVYTANMNAPAGAAAGHEEKGMGEEEEEFEQDVEFVKTLDSDVQEAESYRMLLDCKQSQPQFYGEFTEAEIKRLANYFSVLEFEKDEQIIQKGENATFMGIILSGQYEVPVTDYLTVLLEKGSLVGEMNYFDAGLRVASVKAKTTGVIAVITYMDVDQIRSVDPVLGSKITHMIAKATIKALKYSASAEEKAKKAAADGVRVKRTVRDARLVDTPDEVHTEMTEEKRRSSFVEDAHVNDVYKAEMLFRSRLHKQEKESNEQMMKELERRRRAEKIATERQYKIDTRNKRIKQLQQDLGEKEQQFTQLSSAHEEAKKMIEGLEFRVETLTEKEKDLQERLQKEEDMVDSLQKQLADMEDQAKHSEEERVTLLRQSLKETTQRLEEAQAELRNRSERHESATQNLSEQLQHERARKNSVFVKVNTYKKTLLELQELSDENEEKLRKNSTDDLGLLDPLQLELHTQFMRQKVEERIKDPELRDHAMIVIEYRDQLHRVEAQMGQKIMELSEAKRALERAQLELSTLTAQYHQCHDTLERQTASEQASANLMRQRIHGLEVLLQHQVLFSYVNAFRTRKTLQTIIHDMLDLSGDVLYSIDKEKAQRFPFSFHAQELQKLRLHHKEEMRRRKTPGVAMKFSMTRQVNRTARHMLEVAGRLKEAFSELGRQKNYWKVNANQLLARNNELKEQMQQDHQQMRALRHTVALQERELESVVSLHDRKSAYVSSSPRPPKQITSARASAPLPSIATRERETADSPQMQQQDSSTTAAAAPADTEAGSQAHGRGNSVVPPVIKARKRQAQEIEMLRRRVMELEALATQIAATPAQMVQPTYPPRYIHSARRARPGMGSSTRGRPPSSPQKRAATAQSGGFTVTPRLQKSTRPRTAAATSPSKLHPAPPKAHTTQVDDEEFFAEVFT